MSKTEEAVVDKAMANKQAGYLLRKFGKAVCEHGMIEPGDRILVGVSGGKDSLTLLDLLARYLRVSPVKYMVVAGHVQGDSLGISGPAPAEMREWIERLGVEFHEREISLPENERLPMGCDRCAWNRRKTLFQMAEVLGCNVIALGHNLDDFAETALLNLLQNGKLETMAMTREYFRRFRLIRPMALIGSQDILRYSRAAALPVVTTCCPLAATSARSTARHIIRELSPQFKHVRENLVKAAESKSNPSR